MGRRPEQGGGRGLFDDVAAAQKRAYELTQPISWQGSFCRRDIGYRAINRK